MGWDGAALFLTGEPLAIMPDGYLQRTRVAASSGIAAKYLAREDASVLGLYGTGWQARGQVEAMACVRRLKKVTVYSPTEANRLAFAEEMEPVIRAPIEPVDKPEDVVRGADIVACATNAREIVLPARWVENGMHITDVKRIEIERSTLDRVDRIVIHQHLPERIGGSGQYGVLESDWRDVDSNVILLEEVSRESMGRERRTDCLLLE
jgi:alanine dehydrogenase